MNFMNCQISTLLTRQSFPSTSIHDEGVYLHHGVVAVVLSYLEVYLSMLGVLALTRYDDHRDIQNVCAKF